MATKTIKTRIQQKRDTSANWTKNNPVLLNGERIFVDTDSGELRTKTGDGTKTYTQLPFDDEAIRGIINGKASSNHTHSAATTSTDGFMTSTDKTKLDGIADNAGKEAFLQWGGINLSETYSPVDAAMIPELGANRLAFMPPDAITAEYSRDGGSTWTERVCSNSEKYGLFNGNGTSLMIGNSSEKNIDKSKYMLRITIDSDIAMVYTILNKFAIFVSTGGSTGCYCTIEGKTYANCVSENEEWTTFTNKAKIRGWSGWNIINVAGIITHGNQNAHIKKLRFTFGVASHPSTVDHAGLVVQKILGFGGAGWSTPSNLAKNGRMYTYDNEQNVRFPAKVTATAFNGNASSATKLTSSAGSVTQPIFFSDGRPYACTHTLNRSVPADAKFTDTTYSAATATKDSLMSKEDKAKLDDIDTAIDARMPMSGGSFTGAAKAQDNAEYTTYQLRNMALSTTAALPTGNGALLGVYS